MFKVVVGEQRHQYFANLMTVSLLKSVRYLLMYVNSFFGIAVNRYPVFLKTSE